MQSLTYICTQVQGHISHIYKCGRLHMYNRNMRQEAASIIFVHLRFLGQQLVDLINPVL